MNAKSEIFNNLPVIETERLKLRKLTMRDASDVFEYASVPEVAEHVTWNYHRNIADSIHFLRIITQQYEDGTPAPWGIVLKESKKLVGTIGFHLLSPANHFAEIGYALSKEHWNKGYMTEALRAILDFGFTRMPLNRIEATCKINNTASEKVMLKCRMSFEGILKERLFAKDAFHDLKLYAIVKNIFNAG